jgi:uncharacterized Ntn-hydrolase superfamily protein
MIRWQGRCLAWAVPLAALPWSPSAHATYSIVASDRATLQSGGAGTSCLGGSDVYIIYGSAPGSGVIHAQALFSAAGRQRGTGLLVDGQSPASIIEALIDPDFDDQADSRQYAVVDVTGRVAAFTGDDAQNFAADVQGQLGEFTYSVQGNILTSSAVLSQAVQAFEAGGCDLAERLLRALVAGAAGGEGDSRCTPDGIPSDSAFLQVDVPDVPEGDFLSLRVPSSGNEDPLVELQALFDDWRADHPCAAQQPDAGVEGIDAGIGAPVDASIEPAAGGAAATPPVGSFAGAAGVGGGTGSGAMVGTNAGAGAGSVSVAGPAAPASCACRSTAGAGSGMTAAGLISLALCSAGLRRAVRRRR